MKTSHTLALLLQKLHVKVVTHVPGYGATQVFQAWNRIAGTTRFSFHEEMAFTIAHGAALAGTRAAVLIKAHGLAKAGNSILDAVTAGTLAGLVIMVFDDRTGSHSDSIVDVETLVQGFHLPHLKCSHRLQEIEQAFKVSEQMQLPIAVSIDAAMVEQQTNTASLPELPPFAGSFQRDVYRHLLCPVLAPHQHEILHAKQTAQSWQKLPKPQLPVIPDGLPTDWQQTVQSYIPFFETFRPLRGRIVTGDTGLSALFGFPPFDCIDLCTHMGGSLALAIGAHLAGYDETWAITGDFSFVAAGHLGLVEAVDRKLPLKVAIFVNQKALATGGQDVAADHLQRLLAGYREAVQEVGGDDRAALKEAIHIANDRKKLSILVVML
jgi:TPP-dependent indolepyruvate ferredoxin oxidoreductase alpha subunit